MLERFEQEVSRRLIRMRFAILARRHPEVARLKDHKERAWAMWFAQAGSPRWVRPTASLGALFVGPLILTGLIFLLLERTNLLSGGNWPFLLVMCWVVGAGLCGLLMEGVGGRHRLRACYKSMRLSGHDICPRCGYDMVGHEVTSLDQVRTCPECGIGVELLQKHRQDLATASSSPPREPA